MRPTEVLVKEHEAILEMLEVLGRLCGKLEAREEVPSQHLEQVLAFLTGFADRCHHGKEEDLLFPAMEQAGIPRQGGPIGVMLTEHVQGRDYIQRMVRATELMKKEDPDASTYFARAGRAYVLLLGQHIEKENNVLFRMADMHLSDAQQQELQKRFEQVDQEDIGLDRIQQHLQQLGELKRAYL